MSFSLAEDFGAVLVGDEFKARLQQITGLVRSFGDSNCVLVVFWRSERCHFQVDVQT
ncbi:MAG: hypothetical protein JSV12_03765 [Candidatus Bathyarchaeota archaeon]|nr:MAG: hypothetical protein JSV12_03765 [Candidatus Bathyarchaeota archaeon]